MRPPQSLKLGAAAQGIPILVAYGLNLLATPYVINRLGLANFGLWALTGGIAQYGALFDLGVSRAVVRFVALHHARGAHSEARATVGACLVVIGALAALLAVVPFALPRQLDALIGAHDVKLTQVLFWASIAVLITGIIGAVLRGAATGRGRMLAGNVGLAIQRGAVVVGGVVGIMGEPSLSRFAAYSAIGGFVGLILEAGILLVDERSLHIAWPRLSVLPGLIRFSLQGQIMTLGELVTSQGGKVIAGLIVGPAAAGVYELANRLSLGARSFGASVPAVITAHLTRISVEHGREVVWREYPRLVQRNLAVGAFPLLYLLATSMSAVPLWLGSVEPGMVLILISLSAAYAINVSTGVTVATAAALDQLGMISLIALVSSILAVALGVIFGLLAGLAGVITGIVIAIVLSSLGGVVAIHRTNAVSIRVFLTAVRGPLFVGLIGIALAFPVGFYSLPTNRTSAIMPFLISSLVFTASYLGLCLNRDYLPGLGRFRRRSP